MVGEEAFLDVTDLLGDSSEDSSSGADTSGTESLDESSCSSAALTCDGEPCSADSSQDEAGEGEERPRRLKARKSQEDKVEKKARKSEIKADRREKRKHKVPKHVKKRKEKVARGVHKKA